MKYDTQKARWSGFWQELFQPNFLQTYPRQQLDFDAHQSMRLATRLHQSPMAMCTSTRGHPTRYKRDHHDAWRPNPRELVDPRMGLYCTTHSKFIENYQRFWNITCTGFELGETILLEVANKHQMILAHRTTMFTCQAFDFTASTRGWLSFGSFRVHKLGTSMTVFYPRNDVANRPHFVG